MKDRYVYPAIWSYDKEGIAIEFPDLLGCLTCANTEEEAFKNSKEALAVYMYEVEQDEEKIVDPTPITSIELEPGQIVVLIEVWMPVIRDAIENKAVKKTLTIPKWLDNMAVKEKVNFSQLLQKALKEHLGVDEKGKHKY